MIRRAVLQDIPALMDIYNEAILHTTATFDTEVKDMENRKAWFAEHNGRYVIYVDVEDGKVAGYASLSRYRDRRHLTLRWRFQFMYIRIIEGVASAAA